MTSPSSSFRFEVLATDGAARSGVFSTPHGSVETPAFMPVGTLGAVKTLSPREVAEVGASMILANTYHLYLRPGHEVVGELGGLHKFMRWSGPILTDSGGYQVFSLAAINEIRDDGVVFQSHIDGSRHLFTPERVMEIQHRLGADVVMAFDECPPGGSPVEVARQANERTLRWLERCKARFESLAVEESGPHQSLFPVLQGQRLCGSADRSPPIHPVHRRLERLWNWWSLSGRVQGKDVGHPRGASPGTSRVPSPLPHGGWVSGRPSRVHRPRL